MTQTSLFKTIFLRIFTTRHAIVQVYQTLPDNRDRPLHVNNLYIEQDNLNKP